MRAVMPDDGRSVKLKCYSPRAEATVGRVAIGDCRSTGGRASLHPGGRTRDVIAYQDGNNRDDIPVPFICVNFSEPGKPRITLVDEEELSRRKDCRAPRTD